MKFKSALFLQVFLVHAATVPPGNYVLTRIATGFPALGNALNSFGQAAGNSSSSFVWTPVSMNAGVGSVTSIGSYLNVQSINNRGQVLVSNCLSSGLQLILWTPNSANATAGTTTTLLNNANTGGPYFINSYGQVAGPQTLWTPFSPNATTGILYPDARFVGTMAMNEYGQVICNPPAGPMLFTPAAPNAGAGTFTPIPGLTSTDGTHSSDHVAAINNNGTVVGWSQFCSGGLCHARGFIWTPSSPNGTTGALSEIPVPTGFNGIDPSAINDSGQVEGHLECTGGCQQTPFLYTASTVYDLTAVDSRLLGAILEGMNAAGQMLFYTSPEGGMYLISPTPEPTPAGPMTVPVTIGSTPASRGFTVSGAGCSPGAYSTPQTLNWTPPSNCTVTLISPQSDITGTQYVFTGWKDGPAANPRNIVAPSQATTYSATYSQQYQLAANADPPGSGTVTGGGWYNVGATANLTVSPAPGYRFASWSTNPAVTVTGTNSGSVVVNTNALTVTATFAPDLGPVPYNYAITRLASLYGTPHPRPLNNYGQVVLGSGYLFTPLTPNGAIGSTASLGLSAAGSINNRGQIAGSGITGAVLWTPNTPNGSAGSEVAVTSDTGSIGKSINDFGQVFGEAGYNSSCFPAPAIRSAALLPRGGVICLPFYATSFLWTPSSANATTGSANADAAGAHFVAINDYGQAINSTQLYTPSTPNGTGGTFTTIAGITGLSGTQGTTLFDINTGGVIAGATNVVTGLGTLAHGWVWTPSTPNGAIGAATPIPIPSGYIAITPVSINSSGQVVGTMMQGNFASRPFLYQNGVVYDLSTVNAAFNTVPDGGVGGINDAGQIVLMNSQNSTVYLLSPGAIQLPSADSVSPANGNAQSQVMQFTFSDPRGWQDLDVVNILINNFLDGRQARYLAYSRPLNVLYLVSDSGNGLLPGMPLDGTGGLSNGQCTVFGPGSTAAGTGNSLTLTLNMAFAPAFGGNKVVYLAARDAAQKNSGWQALGTWSVPGAAPTQTAAVSASPAAGAGPAQTWIFTFSDTKGWQDLGVVDILINNFLDGRQACYLAYSRPLNTLYLVGEAGGGLIPIYGLGTVSNGQCSVTQTAGSVSGSGNTLTLTLGVQFTSSFFGNRVIYMAARDVTDTVNSGWQAMGTRTVE